MVWMLHALKEDSQGVGEENSLSTQIDNYCVVGNPIAHTKSPQIHAAFARQTHQNIFYQPILLDKETFGLKAVRELQHQGIKGMNITVPFKTNAWKISQIRSHNAESALAVNTISFDQHGKVKGDNTDGIGLVRDLVINKKITIKDKKLLLLGAGGGVSGVLKQLLDEKPTTVVIANRTISRAKTLCDAFANYASITACRFSDLAEQVFDIVINGTSASLHGEALPLPESIIQSDTCCYDMMYADKDTIFMQWAKAHGAGSVYDGLGMLVEQAAESFFIWRNIRPETSAVIQSLRKAL